MELHRLLIRQLKRHNIDPKKVSKELEGFIEAINDAYVQSDTDRNMLERSLELSSQELLQANSELRAIFQTFPDMFIRMDEKGRVLDFKTDASNIDYPPVNAMVGRTLDEFPLEDVRNEFFKAIEELKQTKKKVMVQFKMQTNGSTNYFEARLLPHLENEIIAIIRNITEAKKAELELIRSEQQYRTVLESSPDPIIVYDMEGNTEFANPAFTKVFGWSWDELKNKKVEFVPESAIEETRDRIQLMLSGVEVQGFETQRYDRSGELLDVIINASLRYDNEGNAVGSVVTIVDITERKKLEEELRFTKEKAESANLAKTEFLANMSHELRTPMHAILGFAKLAIQQIDKLERDKLLGFMEEVHNAGQRLMLLLNDLLDLSKLEVGRVDYDFKEENLSSVVSLVINEYVTVSAEKEIEIVFNKPDFPDKVNIDSNKMIQVVRNLLSNAIKFSNPANKIIINIVHQAGILLFSIKDFGVGIPPDELELVFDKFVQSSKTKTGAGGTGLGLSICYEIIKAHQGRIWARNNQEGGATFFFSLGLA